MSDPEESAHIFQVQIVVVCDDHKAEQFEALLEEHLSKMRGEILRKLGLETDEPGV
jgi:hypothetical protein